MEEVSILCKDVEVSGDTDCILQYFSKKARGISTKTYNFSVVLDLNLVITNKFYQKVSNYMEQGSSILDAGAQVVSGHSRQSFRLFTHLLQDTVPETQPGSISTPSYEVVRGLVLD